MKTNPRIKALASYLDEDEENFEISSYDKCLVTDVHVGSPSSSAEYLVLTDREADKRAAEDIKEHVWAFKPEFIASHSKVSHDATIKVCQALQEQCESANDDITALIKNMKKFIADAISGDGRGHFLAGYDGHEHEVRVGSKTYYIYRVN